MSRLIKCDRCGTTAILSPGSISVFRPTGRMYSESRRHNRLSCTPRDPIYQASRLDMRLCGS